MPFINQDDLISNGLPEQKAPDINYGNAAGIGRTFKTAFQDIPAARAPADFITDNLLRSNGAYDPNFDPYAPENIRGYEQYADSFTDVKNSEDMVYMKSKIDAELREKDILSNSSNATIAQLAAGIADPINMLGLPGITAKIYSASKIGKVALTAGRFALVGGGTSAANEILRQSTQETHSFNESVTAVAEATFFSGVLGGAFGAISKRVPNMPAFMQKAQGEAAIFADKVAEYNGSVGAMATPTTTLEQETLKNTLGLDKALGKIDPVLRTATSSSVVTRRIAQDLAEQPLSREKNVEGIASPIATETLMREHLAPLATANQELEDLFVQYRTGRAKSLTNNTITIGVIDLSGTNMLKLGEFADEVGKSMRRGDVHEIPEVSAAAKFMRKHVFDPLKDAAIKLGLLPEDVKPETAVSYLTRVYDIPKIVAERPFFEKRIADWLKRNQSTMAKGGDEKAQIFARLTDGDLEDIAGQITNTLIGSPRGRLPYGGVPLVRGPLKDRTLTIQDVDIEPWLISDARKISRIYTRTMASDIELTKRFGRADMADQIQNIQDDYQKLRNGVTDPNKLTKLDKQEKADIRDIEAMRDRLRGSYALPAHPEGLAYRSIRAVKNINYMRLLGGMTLSAFSDMGRTTALHGMRTFTDGLVPMIKNFKQYRLASKEVKLAGNALDMVLDERMMSIADVMDDYARTSKFERGIDALSNKFGLVSLMAPWNAAVKQFAGVVTQTRLLQAVEDLGNTSSKELEHLAFLGIDKPMARKIGAQFKQFGNKDDGIYWANTQHWTDPEAATAYRAALSKEVNITIVTPGQDKPLFMSTPIGSLIGQFKSFGMASNQRILMSGLQQRDMAALSGAILSIGLGMLSYGVKTPHDKLSDDWRQWVAEGVDKSGITGSFFDVNNMLEKASHGTVGVSALTGKTVSRYASRNVSGAIFGPTIGLVDDVARVSGDALSGDFNEGDTHALRQMVPFQGVFYLRSLFDAAETGVNNTLGIPAK